MKNIARTAFLALAHLSDGHYVVLHELGAGGVLVGGPAAGLVTWNLEHLTQRYSRCLLLFDHAAREKP